MTHKLGGTVTAEGFIPYKNIGGVDMPVAMNIPAKASATLFKMLQFPVRTGDGRFVYVAPGGGRVVGAQ